MKNQLGYACLWAASVLFMSCDATQGLIEGSSADPKFRVFVSDARSDANLGGETGADTTCSDEASAAGLSGVFRAYLAIGTNPPEDRIQGAGPWLLADGTLIAANRTELGGTVQAFIDQKADGVVVPTALVWIGMDGTGAFDTCSDFTSNSASSGGYIGITGDLWGHTVANWNAYGGAWCANSGYRIYCFQSDE